MKTHKIIFTIGFWIIFAVLQILSFSPLVAVSNSVMIVFFAVFTAVCGFVNFAINTFFRYSKFIQQTNYQQIINIFALAILSFIFVFALSFGSIFLFFPKEIFYNILKILPAEILIYFLVFGIIILRNKIDIQEIIDAEVLENENLENSTAPIEKITQISIKNGLQVSIIQLNEIFFIQSDGDYVQIHTAEKKYLKEQTMKFFEQVLPSDIFIRIHRSYIVNIEHITRIEKFGKDTQMLTLKNGEKIRASNVGYRLLKEKLGL